MVLNVILAILVLSIIVIVHEFGHFIIAKANGITVVEFSIGFGPKLIHFRKGETEYCIKALPTITTANTKARRKLNTGPAAITAILAQTDLLANDFSMS